MPSMYRLSLSHCHKYTIYCCNSLEELVCDYLHLNFFIICISTIFKLLHLECTLVRYKLQSIEFLQLTDLLLVLQRESNLIYYRF